jgi:hypothetical protein
MTDVFVAFEDSLVIDRVQEVNSTAGICKTECQKQRDKPIGRRSHEGVLKLHEGRKTFWRTRCAIDVLLVEYTTFGCIEVCCWDADTGVELPRLFVSMAKVFEKSEQHPRVIEAKEKKYYNKFFETDPKLREEAIMQVRRNLAVQYILSRLEYQKTTDLASTEKEDASNGPGTCGHLSPVRLVQFPGDDPSFIDTSIGVLDIQLRETPVDFVSCSFEYLNCNGAADRHGHSALTRY